MYNSSNVSTNIRYFTITMRKSGCNPSNCNTQNNIYLALHTVEVHRSPTQPLSISGTGVSGSVLNFTCGSTNPVTLSIPTVLSAVSYSWTYPSGWSVSGSNTSNSITLIPQSTTGHNQSICVYAVGSGSCDDGPNISAARCISINRGVPVSGSPITPAGILLCANTTQTLYTNASNISGASYTWQITTGNVRFNMNNGITITTNVPNVVIKTPATGSGTSSVSVRVNTPCGNSQYSSANTISYGPPLIPNTITVNLCSSQPYAVASGGGIGTYNWNPPAPIISLSNNTSTCYFDFDHSLYNQNANISIGVSKTNICGSGPTKWVTVPCSCCPGGGPQRMAAIPLTEPSLTPNPFDNEIKVQVPDLSGEIEDLTIYDLQGNLFINQKGNLQVEQLLHTEGLAKGFYILQIKTTEKVYYISVIKQN